MEIHEKRGGVIEYHRSLSASFSLAEYNSQPKRPKRTTIILKEYNPTSKNASENVFPPDVIAMTPQLMYMPNPRARMRRKIIFGRKNRSSLLFLVDLEI